MVEKKLGSVPSNLFAHKFKDVRAVKERK